MRLRELEHQMHLCRQNLQKIDDEHFFRREKVMNQFRRLSDQYRFRKLEIDRQNREVDDCLPDPGVVWQPSNSPIF